MAKLSDQIKAALWATECGVYSWVIATDTVCADARVADFFELPPELAEHGLPLARYLDRIHVDDRSRTAKAIHEAIVTGDAYQEDYRIVHADQSIVHVFAIGRCFRDKSGVPSEYAGVIYDMTAEEAALATDSIFDLCSAAYSIAKNGSDTVVEELLSKLLRHMGQPVMDGSGEMDTNH
jgi:PAS domain-containing protein